MTPSAVVGAAVEVVVGVVGAVAVVGVGLVVTLVVVVGSVGIYVKK